MKRWLLLALALLVGCQAAPPATEILVLVYSDLQAGRQLEALQVEVRDPAGTDVLRSQEFALRDASALPLSFSLYPLGDAQALRLVVRGRDAAGEQIVEREVIARFVREQRLLLPVFLASACVKQVCEGDRSCTLGRCEPVVEAPLDPAGDGPLGGYEIVARDSEVPIGKADARVPEASVEAGAPAADCAIDVDCAAKLGQVEPAGCALARCVDGRCTFEAADADGDGDRVRTCRASGVELVLGMDCDDTNRALSSREWDGPAGMDGAELRLDRCDELDNDCDGEVDDGEIGGASCTCDPAKDKDVACAALPDGTTIEWPAGSPVGSCRAGKRSCVAGAWTPCEGAVAPKASDSCTVANDDSNCNGVRSEGCQCTDGMTRPCGSEVGSCEPGVQTCVNGRWGSECVGAVTPARVDTCDANNDANCNGVANDGCKCINGAVSTCGQVLPALGDCLQRPVTCTGGVWPAATCTAQCDDCPASEPCAPGSCVDGPSTFSCDCPPGSTGDGTKACTPVNDCPANDPCAPGTCVDGDQTYSCDCPPEYDGDGTTSCTPEVTLCPGSSVGMDAGPGVLCGPHTTCRGSYDSGIGCACESGYLPIEGSDPPACKLP